MNIVINADYVEIDGVKYQRVADSNEMWGMKEIAEYLGYFHSNGKPNTNNLYRNVMEENIKFPYFQKQKAMKGRKPWKKKEVIDWLSIPIAKRREMYKEQTNK